jgi:hypothetical protein
MGVVATEDEPPARSAEGPAMTTSDSAEPGHSTELALGAELVLGPMLRYVSETEATVWVETDRECQVEILGRRAQTFEVAGHHYGLVVIDGLAPGSEHEYQVALDGAVRWPLPGGGFPPSVLRTLSEGRPARLAFGSCRVTRIADRNLDRRARRRRTAQEEAAQEEAARLTPDTAGPDTAGTGRQRDPAGVDALAACAARLRDTPRDQWPDVLLMIGDQAYADEPGPATRRFMAARRGADTRTPAGDSVPAHEVADFAEYSALYQETWSDPEVRWLFSALPTAMIFDDHDVHDDWNISAAWRRDFTAMPWWGRRMESAYQAYWVYQHLGNLSPAQLAEDEAWAKVGQAGDATEVLADLAHRADRQDPGIRWSVSRTFGKVRVVLLDSRSRRVVGEGERRLMADEGEWRWLTEAVSGDWTHVVLATSVPPLLPQGIHTLESWSERICAGAWGRGFARFGERLRQAFDLEHWPAFGASFAKLELLLTELATGQFNPDGEPPATVTVISGDIHHSYLAAVELPKPATAAAGTSRVSAVYEAVCSPFHQAMPPKMRVAQRVASARLSGLIGTAVATLAGAHVPTIRWRTTHGPWFENMIAFLDYDGATARVRFDRSAADPAGAPRLDTAAEARLS